jgi:hypothetical protein
MGIRQGKPLPANGQPIRQETNASNPEPHEVNIDAIVTTVLVLAAAVEIAPAHIEPHIHI